MKPFEIESFYHIIYLFIWNKFNLNIITILRDYSCLFMESRHNFTLIIWANAYAKFHAEKPVHYHRRWNVTRQLATQIIGHTNDKTVYASFEQLLVTDFKTIPIDAINYHVNNWFI